MRLKRQATSRFNRCNTCNKAVCDGEIRFNDEFICDKEWESRYAAIHTKQIPAVWPAGVMV